MCSNIISWPELFSTEVAGMRNSINMFAFYMIHDICLFTVVHSTISTGPFPIDVCHYATYCHIKFFYSSQNNGHSVIVYKIKTLFVFSQWPSSLLSAFKSCMFIITLVGIGFMLLSLLPINSLSFSILNFPSLIDLSPLTSW